MYTTLWREQSNLSQRSKLRKPVEIRTMGPLGDEYCGARTIATSSGLTARLNTRLQCEHGLLADTVGMGPEKKTCVAETTVLRNRRV